MFGISGEHLIILAIVLLIFGPRRLPELGNTMGKAIKNFKDAVGGVEEAQFKRLPPENEALTKTAQQQNAPENLIENKNQVPPSSMAQNQPEKVTHSTPPTV